MKNPNKNSTSFHCTSVSVKKLHRTSFQKHSSCKILPPLISWKCCKEALPPLHILCLMKEQHFQKIQSIPCLLFAHSQSYLQKQTKNLKSTETSASAIISCSVQKVFRIKGFFPCKQASRSAGKLQFASCLITVQVIHLNLFHLRI